MAQRICRPTTPGTIVPSGLQDPVVCCRLFPVTEEGVELDEDKVARMEWVWGLARGGYMYHVETAHNALYLRPDIANLYVNYEFALVPTFKTYLELLKFANHAGVLDRDEEDMSPRRPLTAFASPNGKYRYAYVPLTDAARELQKELPMAPQTEDDLNGGNDPIFNTPMEPGTEDYPIVECYAHPFSVSYFANHTLNFHLTHCPPAFRQWLPILITIFRLWTAPDLVVPQWFIDSPAREDDDITINDSERLGYVVPSLPNRLIRDPFEIDNTLKVDASENPEPRAKVLEWFSKTRQPCALRRALRNKKRSSLDCPRPAARRRRKGSPADDTRQRSVNATAPDWVRRNGHFPTKDFSSSDWAYFVSGASLDGRFVDGLSLVRDSACPGISREPTASSRFQCSWPCSTAHRPNQLTPALYRCISRLNLATTSVCCTVSNASGIEHRSSVVTSNIE